jgi:hypothetical protein
MHSQLARIRTKPNLDRLRANDGHQRVLGAAGGSGRAWRPCEANREEQGLFDGYEGWLDRNLSPAFVARLDAP